LSFVDLLLIIVLRNLVRVNRPSYAGSKSAVQFHDLLSRLPTRYKQEGRGVVGGSDIVCIVHHRPINPSVMRLGN